MKARIHPYVPFATVLAALLVAVPAFAQTDAGASAAAADPFATSTPAGLTSCFDYYRFGSVPVTVTPTLFSFAQGATAGFQGVITNQNSYPIDDAEIYVKVFRDRSDQQSIDGPDVVDQFVAEDHINLKAGESKPVSITWPIPPDAQPGAYKLALYVASSQRFELYGLTFTDDVVGSATPFTVVGTDKGAVRFDNSSVTVGDQPFHFAAFIPQMASTTTVVPITAAIRNTTPAAARVTVDWQLYYWDALQGSHLIGESTEPVTLLPHGSVTVSYTVRNTAHSVYYLLGTLTDQYGSKSVIGVRYLASITNDSRFNFVGTSAFPAEAGKGAAVACIHAPGSGPAENSEVEITATTNEAFPFLSRTIAHASWRGALPQDIYALAAPYTGSADSFTVTASLYQNGSLVDTVSLPYNCTDLGVPCGLSYSDLFIRALVAISIIILIVLGALLAIRIRRKADTINL